MEKEGAQEREQERQQPPSRQTTPSGNCPVCGSGMNRKLFRTGSTQHPGHDMLVCPRCGNRK